MSTDIKIVPLGKRVVVKPEEIQEKTPGGLVIPPSASDDKRSGFGEIVKLGVGTDKNGKRVFEGDFLSCFWPDDGKGIAVFDKRRCGFRIRSPRKTYSLHSGKLEVIGNIHDNPLLIDAL